MARGSQNRSSCHRSPSLWPTSPSPECRAERSRAVISTASPSSYSPPGGSDPGDERNTDSPVQPHPASGSSPPSELEPTRAVGRGRHEPVGRGGMRRAQLPSCFPCDTFMALCFSTQPCCLALSNRRTRGNQHGAASCSYPCFTPRLGCCADRVLPQGRWPVTCIYPRRQTVMNRQEQQRLRW